MTTLIDTNIIIDALQGDPVWGRWSIEAMTAAALRGPLVINNVIFAELSAGFGSQNAVEAMMEEAMLQLWPMPRQALFLAGRAHRAYRATGGRRTGVLADFFIGGQAAVLRLPLMTRDPRRFRRYFPGLLLITPQPDPSATLG